MFGIVRPGFHDWHTLAIGGLRTLLRFVGGLLGPRSVSGEMGFIAKGGRRNLQPRFVSVRPGSSAYIDDLASGSVETKCLFLEVRKSLSDRRTLFGRSAQQQEAAATGTGDLSPRGSGCTGSLV